MKKAIYRASVDTTVVGRFSSESAAKKALTKKVITEIGGGFACGWVDREEEDGSTTSLLQRIIAGGEVGWWRND